ncbi:MAG: GntP family permease [Planctomycetaceae bacterium]|nr:GntP family permease [Planctomycetaceae bacterium]
MYTLFVLLLGVSIVVGGILWLRLHAYLALILASFVVAMMTPAATLDRYFLESSGYPVIELSETPDAELVIAAGRSKGLRENDRLQLMQRDQTSGILANVGSVTITGFRPGQRENQEWANARFDADSRPETATAIDLDSILVIDSTSLRQARKKAEATVGARVAQGFGDTCMKIGILIAMAGIIGKCLLDSGAADRIVRTALRWFGEQAAPVAFVVSGFVLGIPVFFDTVFYLMIPLGKAMRIRTGRNYLLYVLTIVCGGTMAHSLVPPTPGPLAVAEELGVNLGTMILAGGILGLFTATFGCLYAMIANRYCDLPLRESSDVSLKDLEETMQASDDSLPPLWMALTPIILPVILITGNSLLDFADPVKRWVPDTAWVQIEALVSGLGDKNIAIVLSALTAMAMLVRQKGTSLQDLSTSVQGALASGGIIILVTAAGGAFGTVLRQTGVANLVESLPQSSPLMLCTLAFVLTTAIRTAQGSATVAMITAAGILSGTVHSGSMAFHPVYIALAIGCGSKPISWMNDSGFLVITRMSGMNEEEGLKYVTPMTAAMGVVGLLLTLVAVTLWPQL